MSHQMGPLGHGPETSTHHSGASGHTSSPATLPSHSPGQLVMVTTDNTTAVAQLRNHGGGVLSRPLYSHTTQLLLWAGTHNISIVPQHILGKLNIIADCLSYRHLVLNSEWTLSLPDPSSSMTAVRATPHEYVGPPPTTHACRCLPVHFQNSGRGKLTPCPSHRRVFGFTCFLGFLFSQKCFSK